MKCFESFLFLSSSPRALARKGKPTNVIVWITLTVQSLESQHCNMEQYSMNELTDMHLVYGAVYQKLKKELQQCTPRGFLNVDIPSTPCSSDLANGFAKGAHCVWTCPRQVDLVLDTWCGGSHSWFSGRWAFHQLTWNCTSCWVKSEQYVANFSWAAIVRFSSVTYSVS